jgi:hypothetical protein
MGSSGNSGSFEFRPSQSISSTVVDIAAIAAVVYLAKIGIREPVVWSILSGLIVGRFGVAHGKTMERSNRSGGGNGGSGDFGSGPGSKVSLSVEEHERDPRTFARPLPREEPRDPIDPRRTRRTRLAEWIARRAMTIVQAWWSRPGILLPRTSIHVDAISLVVVLVLVATLTRVVFAM